MISEIYPILPNFRRRLGVAAVFIAIALEAGGCAYSGHSTDAARLGTVASSDRMLERLPEAGPVRLQKVVAADWRVDLSGLLNLEHPAARREGLEDGKESIQIYFYVLEHPQFGTYIVDSGLSREFADDGPDPYLSALVRNAMDTGAMVVHATTADWLAQRGKRADGVFLTHLHLDHIMGVPDFDDSVPVYIGPGETRARAFMNIFLRGTTDRLLDRPRPLAEWGFDGDSGGRFAGVIDVFGDESVWAIHAPGHTPGSTAFAVRTPEGPQLIVGDVSHTAWGWHHGVEPGSFSFDQPASAKSLAALRTFAEALPDMRVHLGHQRFGAPGPKRTALLH